MTVYCDCRSQVILALNRAADYKIALPNGKDNSADIVFLVDDLNATRAAIEPIRRTDLCGRTGQGRPLGDQVFRMGALVQAELLPSALRVAAVR